MQRVLVANRGEIALRAIRACRRLGYESLAVFSSADANSPHRWAADHAICIGPPAAAASYLNAAALLETAIAMGCDAIYPGYGFLAENSTFVERCNEAGLTFIGPDSECISRMGDKVTARQTAAAIGIPIVPGSEQGFTSAGPAHAVASDLGFPLLLKASGGGGGRGMRVATGGEDFIAQFEQASVEAKAAFGNPEIYLERFFPQVRHIEIQVFGDHHGNHVHLGERDCSVQRRHQKLVEESPSPALDQPTRECMAEAAVALIKALNYVNAGTVEFIFDPASGKFFFIEMNTRIQVEHPVTEMVTGIRPCDRAVSGCRRRKALVWLDILRGTGGDRIPYQRGRRSARLPARAGHSQRAGARRADATFVSTATRMKTMPCRLTTIPCWPSSLSRGPIGVAAMEVAKIGTGSVSGVRTRDHRSVPCAASATVRNLRAVRSIRVGSRTTWQVGDASDGWQTNHQPGRRDIARCAPVPVGDAHDNGNDGGSGAHASTALGLRQSISLVGAVFDVCVRYLREDPLGANAHPQRLGQADAADRDDARPEPVHVRVLSGRYCRTNGGKNIRQRHPISHALRRPQRYAQHAGAGTCRQKGRPLYRWRGRCTRSVPSIPTTTYARKTRELVSLGVDAVYIKDPSGLSDARTSADTRACAQGRLRHVYPFICTRIALQGLAPYTACRAVGLGVDVVHTATSALANGASHPATEWFVENIRRDGFNVPVDLRPVDESC